MFVYWLGKCLGVFIVWKDVFMVGNCVFLIKGSFYVGNIYYLILDMVSVE